MTSLNDPMNGAKASLRAVAERIFKLSAEADEIERQLDDIPGYIWDPARQHS